MCGIGINESGVDYRNYIQIEKNSQSTTYVEHEEQNYPINLKSWNKKIFRLFLLNRLEKTCLN
jgi:hypothetical protein